MTNARNKSAGTSYMALLKAGEELFAENGFDGTRVEEVVKLAGLNIRMLYHHFGSKEGLFVAVLETLHQTCRDRTSAVFETDASPKEILELAITDAFNFLRDNPNFVRITGWDMMRKGRLESVKNIVRNHAVTFLKPKIEELSRQGDWNPEVDSIHGIIFIWSQLFLWFLNRNEFHDMVGEGTEEDKDNIFLSQLLSLLDRGL